jgi:hypothetical protein
MFGLFEMYDLATSRIAAIDLVSQIIWNGYVELVMPSLSSKRVKGNCFWMWLCNV